MAQAQQEAKDQQALLFRTQMAIADRDNKADLFKHTTQLRFDYWKEGVNSAIEELKLANSAAQADLDRMQAAGEQRANASNET